MEAKNHRIGNLVMYDNRIFAISTIAEEYPTLNTAEFGVGVVDWNNIRPVPLTEYWLDRGGFENKANIKWQKNGIVLLKYPGCCKFHSHQIHVDLFYVHELQNLFAVLKGRELEY